MTNLVLLLVCLGAGALLRRARLVPLGAHVVLNQIIIGLLLPALTFLHLAEARFDQRFVLPVLMPWLVFGAGWLFFAALGRRLGLPRGTVGALVLTGGISSVSFVGFPIFEALYGKTGLELGLVMSLAGSVLVSVTLGVVVASWYGAARPSWRGVGANLLGFPPFLAFVAALAAQAVGYRHPALVRGVLEKLSAPFPVVALLSVGMGPGLQAAAGSAGSVGRVRGPGPAAWPSREPLPAGCRHWPHEHGRGHRRPLRPRPTPGRPNGGLGHSAFAPAARPTGLGSGGLKSNEQKDRHAQAAESKHLACHPLLLSLRLNYYPTRDASTLLRAA